MSAELPRGWSWATVDDLARYVNGLAFKPSDWEESGRPIIRIQNLTGKTAFNCTSKPVPQDVVVREGDILVSWSATLDVFVWRGPEAVLNQHIFKVIPASHVRDHVFLRWALKNAIEELWVSEHSHGTTMKHVNRGPFLAHRVKLPPAPEQRRIADAIESYFTRLDDAVATLERVQRNLKRYRASVLKAAVEGRLVPTEAELARARRVEAASRRFLELSSASEIPDTPPETRRDAASTAFFDRDEGVITKHGNLPHWQQPGRTYFVTFRLADSLPAAVADRIGKERQRWLRENPEPHTPRQRAQYYRLFSKQLDDKLDAGLGSCVLRQGKVRDIVRNALYHFDGERYFLHDWVIMPNHAHVLLTLRVGHDLSKVLHSIKSFSAKKINCLLGRAGQLWQKESFDHIVRNAESFERLRRYVADNPRGLADGEFTLGQVEAASRRFIECSSASEIPSVLPEMRRDPASTSPLETRRDAASTVPPETRRDAASTYEPASVLLTRILAERRRRWEEAELAKMTASGKAPKDDRWKAKYVEPVAPDTSELPELPDGWCWASVDALAAVKGGITKGQKPKAGEVYREVPYLRVANVQRGFLDLQHMKTIQAPEAVIDELRLESGDVLFNEGGDRDKLGRGWIWRGEIAECIHQNHVFRARMYTDDMQPELLSWYGNTAGQQYFFDEGKHTTNLASINLTKLRALPVPVPPRAEQARIRAAVERQISVVDDALASITLEIARSARLRQSILKWAFEGRLVDQDPTDEPASVLLERIRAEREAAGETPGRRPRRRKGSPA